MRLYRTMEGRYVCEFTRSYSGPMMPESYCEIVLIKDSVDEVIDVFGSGKQAQKLYAQAGIDYARRVA